MTVVRILLGLIAASLGMLLASPIILITLILKAVVFLTGRVAQCLEPRFLSWSQVIEFCPTIGWKPKPHLNTYALADDVFQVTTDADGWRGNSAALADCDLLVFGDSHAFGHAIDDKEHFASLNRDFRVKAIGANGYNMVQQVLWMRELAPQLRDKLIVWFVFLGNDLLDNLEPSMLHYRTPFVRGGPAARPWEIVTHHVNAAPWPFVSLRFRQVNYDRLTKIFSPTFLSERAFGACEYLLEQGAELCRRAGARLIILTIPDPLPLSRQGLERLYAHGAQRESFDPDLPDRRIRAVCDRLSLPFVAGKSCLSAEDYREHDDHWNERGHQRVAKMLSDLYRRHAVEMGRSRPEAAGPASAMEPREGAQTAAARRPEAMTRPAN